MTLQALGSQLSHNKNVFQKALTFAGGARQGLALQGTINDWLWRAAFGVRCVNDEALHNVSRMPADV